MIDGREWIALLRRHYHHVFHGGSLTAANMACHVEAAELAQAKIEKLEADLAAELERGRLLGELLAIIHRDGGQYLAKHGAAQATEDAIAKVGVERQALEEAEEHYDKLKDAALTASADRADFRIRAESATARLRSRPETTMSEDWKKRCESAEQQLEDLLSWAEGRYAAEVSGRPSRNIHRNTLHVTWLQMINHMREKLGLELVGIDTGERDE